MTGEERPPRASETSSAEPDDVRADYISPLARRYATVEMIQNFTERTRVARWRSLWIALARCERALGVPITEAQIEALEQARDHIDLARVEALELELRHDVMAHVRHFGEVAGPEAARIIHLGATSCFVTDNGDMLAFRRGLELVLDRLVAVVAALRAFAATHREVPTLAYTHFQPAQLTTVGKRACLWLQDLVLDVESIEALLPRLALRGAKGTTGTQASYLTLLGGDEDKVRALDEAVCAQMGVPGPMAVTGQTYTRKLDTWIMSALADVAGSAAKFATDLRLLAHERELEEPFGEKQVGSSAMAYKRNPMRSERICSLARYVHSLATSPRETHAQQWLERTLDDSANRRLVLTDGFLAVDAILNLMLDVTSGLVIHEAVIRENLQPELAFMATENVLMRGTRAGESRQELHERIREHSMRASRRMKEEGGASDLLERMRKDPLLAPHVDDSLLAPEHYVGRSPRQVEEFLTRCVDPLLTRHAERLGRFVPRVSV